ncbi:hypothetical protein K466DRAFT_496806 [Polyporus arcularius HHB13444]|uniref:DUF6532 domain-containing protein n=1 Tax=Polyporus arcularius HHB13444 TaxID=1314778 RepID=A0A5C3P4C3_9APHY|nr:hypothetical protein K466DRAFT_496806 [Polyporus arcularius HHB13444]
MQLTATPAPPPSASRAPIVATTPTSSESVLRDAPFRDGKEPRSGARPNASDYIDEVRDLLSLATARYSVSIYTINAFPHTAQQREFVVCAWNEVGAAQARPVPWKLSDRMIAAVRVSLIFDLETGTKSRFAEHRFLDTAIVTAFFWNQKTGIGYEYASYFNPMPEPAIAFILTVIHAHLLEWSTGQRVQDQFTETSNSGFYTGFSKDLRRVGVSNETASVNIRRRLFERTFRAGGGLAMTPTVTQVSSSTMAAAVAELAERSGLTDSEGEEEDELETEEQS